MDAVRRGPEHHGVRCDLIALTAVLLAAAPSAWWLAQNRFWASHDGVFHLYRVVELGRLARLGEIVPGWLPTFAAGYGYPIFNYYPPLAFVPSTLASLAGLGPVDAFKLSLALPIFLSALGAYLLGRDLFKDRLAGWLIAVAYVYAPYRFYDTYMRASPSGAWVFPFMPLLLWSIGRAAAGSRRQLALSALWLALLVLAHNVTALFFLPVALVWAAGAIWTQADRRAATLRVASGLALGLAVGAGYWIPTLAEAGWVSTSNFNSPEYLPQSHLVSLADLVDVTPLYDHTQPMLKYGFVQLGVALAGLAAWPWLGRRRAVVAFGAAVTIVVALLQTPILEPIWSLPLLSYIQRPSRLLAIGALGTALMAGGASALGPLFRLYAPLAGAALVISGLAWLAPFPLAPADTSLTEGSQLRSEADSGIIGTTSAAEYLPVWARGGFVAPNEGYARPFGTAGDEPFRVRVIEAGAIDSTVRVQSERGGPLRLHSFYFPGWTASIDGAPAPVYPSSTVALLTVDVPPGEHTVAFRFEPTQLRRLTAWISALSVIGALILLLGWRAGLAVTAAGALLWAGGPWQIRQRDAASWSAIQPAEQSATLDLAGGRWRVAEGGIEADLFWLSRAEAGPDGRIGLRLVDDRGVIAERWARPLLGASPPPAWTQNELVREQRIIDLPPDFEGGLVRLQLAAVDGWRDLAGPLLAGRGRPSAPPPEHPSGVNFDGKVILTGYDLTANGGSGVRFPSPAGAVTFLPGDTLHLRLLWQPLDDFDDSYTVFVHLIGPDGRRYDQRDHQPDDGFRSTATWQRAIPVEDHYTLGLPVGAPPGAYRIEVGLYRTADEERLSLAGSTLSALVLGRQKVPGPPVSPDAQSLARFGVIALNATRSDGGIVLSWWAAEPPTSDYTVFVHALDREGHLVAQNDGPPLDGRYPTSLWSPGEVIHEQRPALPLPPGGRIVVGLYDPETGQRLTMPDGRDSVEIPG